MAIRDTPDAEVSSTWTKIRTLADALIERSGREDGFPVQPGSALDGDDRHSVPHQVSHSARMNLAAAIDHLHALCVLTLDSGVLHLAAPATLARGALETASTAIWMLVPNRRDDRITRALQWNVQDIKDGDRAATDKGIPVPTPLQRRLDKVKATAASRGLDYGRIGAGYTSTAVVTAAETHVNSPLGVVLPWRLCSGFSHGRRWAYVGFLELERRATKNPEVVNARMENDFERLLYLALPAAGTVKSAIDLYDTRAKKP